MASLGTAPAAASAAGPRELKRLCVFCGASSGSRPQYLEAARALGRELVGRRIGLVYGGGTVGLMGEVARTVVDGLGTSGVMGVIPEALTPREVSGEMIGELHVVDSMHERKAKMAAHADGFIALPGGFGTLEELLEVMTWQQLGFHGKPIGLLNVEGFFDPLVTFFEHCVDQGFVKAQHYGALMVSSDAAQLIEQMKAFQPPPSYVEMAKHAAAQQQQGVSDPVGMDVGRPSDEASP